MFFSKNVIEYNRQTQKSQIVIKSSLFCTKHNLISRIFGCRALRSRKALRHNQRLMKIDTVTYEHTNLAFAQISYMSYTLSPYKSAIRTHRGIIKASPSHLGSRARRVFSLSTWWLSLWGRVISSLITPRVSLKFDRAIPKSIFARLSRDEASNSTGPKLGRTIADGVGALFWRRADDGLSIWWSVSLFSE